MIARIEAAPRRTLARVAGTFYVLNIAAGSMALVLGRQSGPAGDAASLFAAACYVVVTLIFYVLFRPVQPRLSLLAALFSLVGCAAGALGPLHLGRSPISPLALFGVYCILIAALILKSRFLPRVLGVLMAIGGLGWLTFAYPPLVRLLSPWNLAPGILGEGALTLWLLVFGVSAPRSRAAPGRG